MGFPIFTTIGAAAGAYFGGPAGAAAGIALGSAFDGAAGEDKANQTNIRLYEDNRDWQERMSNTAYTRASNDLTAAGFNKLLATGAQASTPSMQAPTVQNSAKHYANSAAGVLGAVQATQTAALNKATIAKTEAEVGNLAENNKLLQAQTKKAQADTLKANVDAAVAKKGIPEAELKNDVYDLIRPGIKKAKEIFLQSAPKHNDHTPILRRNP